MDNPHFLGQTGVPVQNRFEIFNPRESAVTQNTTQATSNVTRDDFVQSNMDSKRLHMFDELRFIRQEQVNNSLTICNFQTNLSGMNDKLSRVIHVEILNRIY